ncbi:hypothetical protein Vadar_027634 [Vaccinium darrowii]|uniref:Uncharacterized protein n=1 Tax=Vaccinium darrowii TaxID=229202 RepID=A0ACB7Z942_9ERIC|nr:hypothetical protein Vadar_027634 [Vaccinium darrowii]
MSRNEGRACKFEEALMKTIQHKRTALTEARKANNHHRWIDGSAVNPEKKTAGADRRRRREENREWTPGDIDGESYSDLDVEDDIIYYIQNDNAKGLRSLLTYPDVRNGIYRWPNGVLPPTGMLPLSIALDATRRLMQLYRQESLFKSIELLCRPSMKKSLDVSKLLVESSNNIEEFAYYYAMEGKLVELAVLLIVAREKVLNGRMMIPRCVSNQILSLIDEVILVGECKHGELAQIQQKMMSMSLTALLLEVFERAGHTIEEYLQSQQPDSAPGKIGSPKKKAFGDTSIGVFNDPLKNEDQVRVPLSFLSSVPPSSQGLRRWAGASSDDALLTRS